MITQGIQIEEFMAKRAELMLQKDIKQGSTYSKDKSKYVNKNREALHLMDNIHTSKTIEKSILDIKTVGNKAKNSS